MRIGLKYQWGIWIVLLLICTIGRAQIMNIDKIDTLPYTNKAKWDGNIATGLEIDKQNSTLYDASNFLDLSLQKKNVCTFYR